MHEWKIIVPFDWRLVGGRGSNDDKQGPSTGEGGRVTRYVPIYSGSGWNHYFAFREKETSPVTPATLTNFLP